jgi:hypothetical protein
MSAHLDLTGAEPATSGPPVPLAHLHLAVERARQVRRAIAAGARLTAESWSSLGAWHLIVTAPDDLAVSDIHPGAEALATLARDDLLLTARAVLEAGGDISRVADSLHLHRTTLYYRLERIEALAGVNLKLPQDRDALLYALRLAAYRGTC